MRDYGKVYTAFWTSDDSRGMSEDGKILALYLLTCPHGNMLGCFRLTNAYAADDLQWDAERVSKGFDELFKKRFAYRCEKTSWVFIRQYLKWNQFENPNVGKAAGKLFDSINAPHAVKALLVQALREYSEVFPLQKLEAFEGLGIPFDNPFGLSSKTRASATTTAIATTKPNDVGQNQPDPVVEIFDYWKTVMSSPRSVLDGKRDGLIRKALKSYSPADICKAIRGCSKSPFNMGKNDRKTKYNGLGLILRDAEHIDHFIELDGGEAKPADESVGEMNARIAAEFLSDGGSDDNTIDMEPA